MSTRWSQPRRLRRPETHGLLLKHLVKVNETMGRAGSQPRQALPPHKSRIFLMTCTFRAKNTSRCGLTSRSGDFESHPWSTADSLRRAGESLHFSRARSLLVNAEDTSAGGTWHGCQQGHVTAAGRGRRAVGKQRVGLQRDLGRGRLGNGEMSCRAAKGPGMALNEIPAESPRSGCLCVTGLQQMAPDTRAVAPDTRAGDRSQRAPGRVQMLEGQNEQAPESRHRWFL